jgi:hypothetical protein
MTTTTTLPPAEVCGNCRDDDGNGLVDDLDPACCADPLPLRIRPGRIAAGRHAGSRSFRLRLDLAPRFAAADPRTGPLSLAVAGSRGAAVCTTIDAWQRRAGRFRHHGAGSGITNAVLTAGHAKVTFVARGRHADLTTLSPPELTVAVRVGTWCARGRASLVRRGTRLVTP